MRTQPAAGMYQKHRSIVTKGSVSAMPNNLTCCTEGGKVNLGFVNKSQVIVVSKSPDGTSHQSEVTCKDVGSSTCATLTQAKWVKTGNGKTILVIASTKSVQFFHWDGSVFLLCHALPQELDATEATFARGIGTCGPSLICVGTQSGAILVFLVSRDESISFCQKTDEHGTPITDIHGFEGSMASGDDKGSICFWNGTTALTKVHKVEGAGWPCVSIRVWHDLVLAGYASGHLRIFSSESCQIVTEVTAHARWISAVDIAPDTGLALTASEDSFLRVWKLEREGDSTVQLKYTATVSCSQLMGAAFLSSDGKTFAVTAYDSSEVFCFKQ
ncbi:WD repeat-containing protein 54-like [Ornithodoros turicata]|uniref:WD repeat-containing protein 54-like n=1 Tax=Ornithodoros turicata TaxID=34597 RepID=UPI003139AA7C